MEDGGQGRVGLHEIWKLVDDDGKSFMAFLNQILEKGVPALEGIFGKKLVVEVLGKPLGETFEVFSFASFPREEVDSAVPPQELEEECRFSNPSPSVNDCELGLSLSESLFEQAKFGLLLMNIIYSPVIYLQVNYLKVVLNREGMLE